MDEHELANLIETSDSMGPIFWQMDTTIAIALIRLIQYATRHPIAKESHTAQQVCKACRTIQDGLVNRDPRFGPILERGWSSIFHGARGTDG